jgi:hypothetical protein
MYNGFENPNTATKKCLPHQLYHNVQHKIDSNHLSSFNNYCSENNHDSPDSLTSVNYFIPSNGTEHSNSDLTQLEEDSQFGFGGCSQEEISNIVDQVLSTIDAFPTTTTTIESDIQLTSGTLCQDCGNFVELEPAPIHLELFCQHCGASIKCNQLQQSEESIISHSKEDQNANESDSGENVNSSAK